MMRIVYLALLLLSAVVVSAQDDVNAKASDSPSDVPSMSPGPGSLVATPTLSPIAAQIVTTLLPTSPSSTCDICGPGREVGEVGKGIIFEGNSITCGELQALGEGGLIPIEVCVSVISVFNTQDPCKCQDVGNAPNGTTPTVPPTSLATCWMHSYALTTSVVAAASAVSLLLLS